MKFEPQHFHPRINIQRATYHDAYQTTACFLGWVANHYDSTIVTKLNDAARFGRYKNDLFRQYCGKSVDALWAEFIAAYQSDPAHILQPLLPAAMMPRTLPDVTPGSSVAINLSTAFDVMGYSRDGASFSSGGGFDGGGAAYPGALLGTKVTWKNLSFNLGKPGVADTVTCRGNAVACPAGSYKSVWLLAGAIDGSHQDQAVTVTYTDGSTKLFAQNFSDWYTPEGFPGEVRAVRCAYRNMADGSKDGRTFYVYAYGFPLDPGKTVKSVTLPNDDGIRVLAITLAN